MGEVEAIRTIYRLAAGTTFVLGGLAIGLCLDSAAHAADKPPAAEQPGGLPGAGQLPEQASDRARDVLARLTEQRDEPTSDPEPEQPPADEPAPADDRPRTDPTPAPPAEPAPTPTLPALPTVPDVIDDVVDPVEDVVEQLPVPPLPELPPPPPVDKTPTRDDTPIVPPVDALPLNLPVTVGPVLATQIPPDGAPLELHPRGVRAPEEPECADQTTSDRDYERGTVRRILDRITGLHRATRTAPPLTPCPGTPGAPDWQNHQPPAVKPPNGYGADLTAATTSGYTHPTPGLLRHIWPRCHLPTSPTLNVEPGPA